MSFKNWIMIKYLNNKIEIKIKLINAKDDEEELDSEEEFIGFWLWIHGQIPREIAGRKKRMVFKLVISLPWAYADVFQIHTATGLILNRIGRQIATKLF